MALITIASVVIPGWQGNTTGIQLRIYTNADFTASTGTLYPKTIVPNIKTAGLGSFYQANPCTVSGTTLTLPAVTLDSTTDSPDNPNGTYSAVLFDSISGKQIQDFGTFSAFSLSPTPTSTTWAAIFAAEADA
jgi:hypothetical protein